LSPDLSGTTENKLVLLAMLTTVVLGVSMVMLIQNAQVVRADAPKGCTGDPHDYGQTGDPHNEGDSGNPHRGHHNSCPGDK
jgi:hypothetical protein